MGRFEGKVALVTGAGSGIGRATALAFAREGAKVVAADVNEAAVAETARLAQSAGVEAEAARCDVSREADARAAVALAVERFGRLDVAHNNAGIEGPLGRLADLAEADFDRVLAVNLKGVFLCMKHEIAQMTAQGGGAIVNTASVAGLVGFHGAAAYAASKHGVVGLTRTAALEYAKRGVRVNAVCPGVVETPMVDRAVAVAPRVIEGYLARQPVGRLGRADEVAAAVLWLASDEASFVTGAALPVDGAWTAQ